MSNKLNKFCWIVSIIMLVFIGGLLTLKKYLIKSDIPKHQINTSNPTTTPAIVRGRLILRSNIPVMGLDDLLLITVDGDSTGESINGYDIDLFYDSNHFQLKEVKNMLPDLVNIYTNRKDGKVLVTGMKKIEVKDKLVLKQTPLIAVNFTAKKIGKASFNLNWTPGSKRDCNLINDLNIDIVDEIGNVEVAVGEQIYLTRKLPTINFKNLTLYLLDINVPSASCYDCFSEASVVVSQDSEKQTLKFKTGGFAGKADINARAFKYNFFLKHIENNQLTLLIYED